MTLVTQGNRLSNPWTRSDELVYHALDAVQPARTRLTRVRIALAGCGVVGAAFLRELQHRKDEHATHHGLEFEVVCILVNTLSKERDPAVDHRLLTDNLTEFLLTEADVIVEAIGGTAPAKIIAETALRSGRRFITANKALLALHGSELASLAEHFGGSVQYDAAVGGGVPMLGLINRAITESEPTHVRAILNGTTNFVLTRVERGHSLEAALADARTAGFAELDASRDLDGRDAADKLALIAWSAFGVLPEAACVHRRSLLPDPSRYAALASRLGGVVRQVAECVNVDGVVLSVVEPLIVSAEDDIAQTFHETNRLDVYSPSAAPYSAHGAGAGGVATAGALLSDLLGTGSTPREATTRRSGSLDQRLAMWAIEVEGSYASTLRALVGPSVIICTNTDATRVWCCLIDVSRACIEDFLSALINAGGDPVAAKLDARFEPGGPIRCSTMNLVDIDTASSALDANGGALTTTAAQPYDVSTALPEYEITGPNNAPVILALGGISATRHVVQRAPDDTPGWWEGVAGAGCALDTNTHRILSIDFVDGQALSDGKMREHITTHDQAAAVVAVLDALGIEQLDAFVGASYGGMVALALAERWPERVRRIVVVSAAHESHPMSTGLRAMQRRIVALGVETGRTCDAMALARGVAMTTYRTAREFGERFATTPTVRDGNASFGVEEYLMAAGERFAQRMPAHRFLTLSASADLHSVTPENVAVPVTVIAAEGDTLVPPDMLAAMAARLPKLMGYHLMATKFGHDAFLTEPTQLSALLSSTLAS